MLKVSVNVGSRAVQELLAILCNPSLLFREMEKCDRSCHTCEACWKEKRPTSGLNSFDNFTYINKNGTSCVVNSKDPINGLQNQVSYAKIDLVFFYYVFSPVRMHPKNSEVAHDVIQAVKNKVKSCQDKKPFVKRGYCSSASFNSTETSLKPL